MRNEVLKADAPLLGFTLSELGTLYKEISRLAGDSLAKVAEGDDREKPREKALFKMCGLLKNEIDTRKAADARLLAAVYEVTTEK